jgi:hypothetical protein
MSTCDASIDELNELCTLQANAKFQRTPGQILSLTRHFDFSLNHSPAEHARKDLANEQYEGLAAKSAYNFDKLNASTSILQQANQQHCLLNHSNPMNVSTHDPSYFKTWSFKLKNDVNVTKKKLVKRNSSVNLRQRLYGCSDDTPLKWSKYKSFDSSVSKNLKRLFTTSPLSGAKNTGLTADFDLFKIEKKSLKVLTKPQKR